MTLRWKPTPLHGRRGSWFRRHRPQGEMIDLSSDVVTLPTPAMRKAIFRAELGNDASGLDPTVNRLQAMAAERVGKEAALLVASGTMGNLVVALVYCRHGEGFIVGSQAHMNVWEPGIREVAGLKPLAVPNLPDATLDLDSLESQFASGAPDLPPLKMLTLENSHNRCGGVAMTPDVMSGSVQWARRRGLTLHLDGSRVFNTSVALGIGVPELTRAFDSVMFCLSKGLSCPVGSLICGDKQFIQDARRMRTRVGGDMRQAGIIAAAGIVALDQMVDRLHEDHENAKYFAQRIRQLDGLRLAQPTVDTNIVRFHLVDSTMDPAVFVGHLAERGLSVSMDPPPLMRAVMHSGIDRPAVTRAADILEQVLPEELARSDHSTGG